jgi:uncharacterized membrane protein
MRWQDRSSQFLILGLPALALLGVTAVHGSLQTVVLVASSVALFFAAWCSARQLLGLRNTAVFAALGLSLGWFAEQMGSSRGWFFGRYTYTDVLGPRLGDVPLVIPLMWFALCFVGYILAKLLLWREPQAAVKGWLRRLLTALLAAMLVTAFDLGADPYFVFVLKAWIMQKTDGGWFGETLQGFVGWMLISFLIVLLAQYLMHADRGLQKPASRSMQLAAALPIAIYTSGMLFQMTFGHPIETRVVAFFAMGIPILAAAAAWWHWQQGD